MSQDRVEPEAQKTAPGAVVEEVSSGVRAVGGARTSIAVFLAKAAHASGEPLRLTSWKAFGEQSAIVGEATDGESDTTRIAVSKEVWAAVHGWFANGGGECYLAPVDGKDGLADTLSSLEAMEDITIVVAPDLWSETTEQGARAEAGLIADHCARMANRVAVLHLPEGADSSTAVDATLGIEAEARGWVTVYHPWINVAGPGPGDPVTVPPSGHVAGVWARVDAERGVHKAPANEGLRGGVISLTQYLTDAEQATLNDQGVNAIRQFPGTGHLVWGARTLAAGDVSDVEHAYLNVRRSMNFIKQSILQSTQWAVFEPNDERLQTSVTAMISSFLTGLWRRGMLRGQSPEQAFYVVCDATNNPPEEVLQGKLTAEVGVALVRPAEFITFRVSQVIGQS
ncbi:phage tail sheath family protein [Streptomyces spectabilis]|uniref:Phage tail sheath family protein n=1 Tax=Streptomyces spectabilis TaxID=68270 RepID=A0A516R152_STRST|nr:phage tail sheath subtilisin-like domain-containing protein [Streptomyces spectabilis]QDQ09388.1 phage tail sheath family protein [Streptomyces spectabilis]